METMVLERQGARTVISPSDAIYVQTSRIIPNNQHRSSVRKTCLSCKRKEGELVSNHLPVAGLGKRCDKKKGYSPAEAIAPWLTPVSAARTAQKSPHKRRMSRWRNASRKVRLWKRRNTQTSSKPLLGRCSTNSIIFHRPSTNQCKSQVQAWKNGHSRSRESQAPVLPMPDQMGKHVPRSVRNDTVNHLLSKNRIVVAVCLQTVTGHMEEPIALLLICTLRLLVWGWVEIFHDSTEIMEAIFKFVDKNHQFGHQ